MVELDGTLNDYTVPSIYTKSSTISLLISLPKNFLPSKLKNLINFLINIY